MNLVHWVILVFFSIPVIRAVSLEDAFVKDWITYLHGDLVQFDITPDGYLIGLTSDSQLVNVGFTENYDLKWSLDLSLMPTQITDIHLQNNVGVVWIYSKTSRDVFLYESDSGLLQSQFRLPSNPKQIVNFFNKTSLILGSDGIIYFIDITTSAIRPLEVKEHIDKFQVSLVDGFAYVIINDTLMLKLNALCEVVSTNPVSIGAVQQFKDGIILSKSNKVFKLNQDEVVLLKAPSKLKNLKIIDEQYSLDYNDNTLILLEVSSDKLEVVQSGKFDGEIIDVKVPDDALNDFLIIYTLEFKFVLDLATLLTGEFTRAKKQDLQNIKLTKDVFAYNDGDLLLYTISSTSEHITITLLNLLSGSVRTINHILYDLEYERAILVDKPTSKSTMNKFHDYFDTGSFHTFTASWLLRIKRHLKEIGEFMFSLVVESINTDDNETINDEFGFQKLIVVPDITHKKVVAFDTKDGSIFWVAKIDDVIESSNIDDFVGILDSQSTIVLYFRSVDIYIDKSNGEVIKCNEENRKTPLQQHLKQMVHDSLLDSTNVTLNNIKFLGGENYSSNQYIAHHAKGVFSGYKLIANSHLSRTWQFSVSDEEIVGIFQKPEGHRTMSAGISLHDKSVLYKYLNPNVLVVLTRSSALNGYILDGVTGSVLYAFSHQNEDIDFDSINLVIDDNWVIYSYVTKFPRFEQRINVIDMFDSSKGFNVGDVSAFTFNTTIDSLTSKSFIFPERISSLSSTQTQFGITVKSILALTESGNLIELPKYVLNSRRIDDRVLTQDDFQDDFRMMPYDPIITKNNFQILNHKHRLGTKGKILSKLTHLESTAQVCYISNSEIFCQYVQPSLSYDLLSESFDKIKLILTIVAVAIAYVASKPFVSNKNLNSYWIDRQL
ncbi:uncharacterized protein PRCAT00005983001 [Priceomyces carsonii]|uniref:uncharacterized protein n=1 Tax=Priceomyces carsonii TaxID=28549 RepID=UPI002EDA3513|nr:unnamed protein product [Priceomyces carsonii]